MENKCRIFEFIVSSCDDRLVDSVERREAVLSAFVSNHIIADMKVNTVDVDYHNNGKNNTILMIYTFIYSDN